MSNSVYLTAMFVMTVGVKLTTCRNLVFVGSLLNSAGFIITSRAVSINVLLFSYGVLIGLGYAFTIGTSIIMVGLYFDKRRGLATTLAIAGGSVGSLVFAPLITALLEYYGYEGLMIIGAIYLNGFVSAFLFRPPGFYKSTCVTSEEGENALMLAENTKNAKVVKESAADKDNPKFNVCQENTEDENKCVLKVSDQVSSERAAHNKNNNLNQTHAVVNAHKTIAVDTTLKTSHGSRILKTAKDMFHLRVFRKPSFIAFIISAILQCPAIILSTVFVAPFAKEIGVDSDRIALLFIIYSILDFFSRLLLALIADKSYIQRTTLVACCSLMIGVTGHLLRWYTSFEFLVAYACILGLVSGVYFSFYAVIIVDIIGLDTFQQVLGFTESSQCVTAACEFYIVGYLHDVTGNWVVPFHFLGSSVMLGGIIMFFLPKLKTE
ncbi:MOT5-like protein [Mya arenaria]|uniref:MOT5-like protein n=1 Tax=Mya arenaria TaxID=6604 RepID=A0ABY7G1U6_MYAAR|nr:MOT5-like protein [Mya arenaria]